MSDLIKKQSKIAEREEQILKFWQDNKIFEKTLDKKNKKGFFELAQNFFTKDPLNFFRGREFVFYDGPPFATGLPHYGHILVSTIKDVIPRYKTMQGFKVLRRWGWDCHGLPIENIVEKELHISGRKQIEEYGVGKFNEYARSKVLTYVNDWKRTVERIGRWVDFDGSYKTMDNTYIESVWWALKKLNDKKLIYEGTKVLPYCPRCETPIANSEIAMDNSYKDISDISVYVKFPIKGEENKYLLAWTTTPWTLPGNFALAVNGRANYVVVEIANENGGKESLILAKDRLSVLKIDYRIIAEIKGSQLAGQSYTPPFEYFLSKDFPNKDHAWRVYVADFVTMTDGTGIVHIAPGYGEDDMNLAKKEGIPFIHHVGTDGKFMPVVSDFVGRFVKPKENPQEADIEIIKYLAGKKILLAKEKIVHPYPHCYRCETPLYYYAIPAWFIKIQGLKSELVSLNEKINWIPEHLKEGRFKKGIEGAPDWNISRNRFWASPLPFWKCEKCTTLKVVGSLEEITKRARNKYFVVRHGEAENNILRVTSSRIENKHHLTKEGEIQVKKAAKKFQGQKIDFIFYSPIIRTTETAKIIAIELGLSNDKVISDLRLREVEHGIWENKTVDEYRQAIGDDWTTERFNVSKDGVESYNQVRQRVGGLFLELEQKYSGKTIIIVSHDVPSWMMEINANGMDAKEAVALRGNSDNAWRNAEVREIDFLGIPRNENFELDLHRPYIDSIEINCSCGEKMKRTKEVIDCWFESGAMPFASNHYPFENKDWLRKRFPADFVAEYVPQTRTWFYYMHVLSTALFGNIPFKNVLTHGTILAEDGQKMSKSKGNFPDPWLLFDKYGVDALRFYLLSTPALKAEDLNFSERGVDEVSKKILTRLDNVLSFYILYKDSVHLLPQGGESPNVLDVWIKARLGQITEEITKALEKYELDKATRAIGEFVDDLSVWYLRRSRERFKGENDMDKRYALATLRFVLAELSKLIAPFVPFFAEHIYQKLNTNPQMSPNYTNKKEADFSPDSKFAILNSFSRSVHLEDWPTKLVDYTHHDILRDMKRVREIVSKALELRATANIKVRQPLALLKLKMKDAEGKLKGELCQLIKDEVNVKNVQYDAKLKDEMELDTTITPELREEGQVRELIRAVQELRKDEGLTIKDFADLSFETDKDGEKIIEKNKNLIMKTNLLKSVSFATNLGSEGVDLGGGIFVKIKLLK